MPKKRGQPMVSVVGGSETVASALAPCPKLPSRMQVFCYRLGVWRRQRWPEAVCVAVCALLGVCIGLAISFSTMPVPKVAYYITRMGQWGAWPKCSVSCGFGSRRRERIFEFDPDRGSQQCPNDGCPAAHEYDDACQEGKCCVPGVSGPHGFADGRRCYIVLEPGDWAEQRSLAGRRGIPIDGFGRAPDTETRKLPVVGGELASIHSDAENDFVFELALAWWKRQPDTADKYYFFWIGLKCADGPTTCYWSDGSDVDYLGLTFNYPWPKEVQCAVIDIRKGTKRTWQLMDCANYLPSVRRSYPLPGNNHECEKAQVPKCYQTTDERKNWEESANDGYLATIQSQEELDWIKDTVLQGLNEDSKLWIGLRCNKDWPDLCYWMDGTSLSFSKDLVQSLEGDDVRCGALSVKGDWSLESCDDSLLAIKEPAPRCDKLGYPEWTEWSPCYVNANLSCDSVQFQRGYRYKLWSTPYVGSENCPAEPVDPHPHVQDENCNFSCVVGQTRPPPPAMVDRDQRRACDWFTDTGNERTEGNEWTQGARIRGSEDFDMIEDVFHNMAYINELIESNWHEPFNYVSRRKNDGPLRTESDGDYVYGVNSNIDMPCAPYRLDVNREDVRLFSVNGKCFVLIMEPKGTWQEQSNQCKNINATLATFNNSINDTYAALNVAYYWNWPFFIGLQRNDTGTYWGSNGGTLVNDDDVAFDGTLDSIKKGCGLLDGDKVKDQATGGYKKKWSEYTYVSLLEDCGKKHMALCQFPQKQTHDFTVERFRADKTKGWLTERVNWKECRCQLFDEASEAVDIDACYKIGSETKFRNVLSDGSMSFEDRKKEAKELDLVTISNDLEYKEMQAVVEKHWKATIKDDTVSDDPCNSVITHRPFVGDSSKCFVLHVYRDHSSFDKPKCYDCMDRVQASHQCKEGPNGQLVTAEGEGLLQKLQSQFQGQLSSFNGSVWTGARNVGGWKWEETGAQPRAEVWEGGKPKRLENKPMDLHCATADPKDNYKLKTVNCNEERPFLCHFHPHANYVTYKVRILTGWRRDWISSTVAEVRIVLYGANGRKTDEVALNAEGGHFKTENSFDTFTFEAFDIGDSLKSVLLTHKNKAIGSGTPFDKGWHLATIRVEIPSKKLSYFKSANRLAFKPTKEDGDDSNREHLFRFERQENYDKDPCAELRRTWNSVSIGSSCFQLKTRKKPFEEAQRDCASSDFGVLAHVRDLETVLTLKEKFGNEVERAWIGLTHHVYLTAYEKEAKAEHEYEARRWFWVDSWEPAGNTWWDDGYVCDPTNPEQAYETYSEDGDCAYMEFKESNGRFRFKRSCKEQEPKDYICQYDMRNPCRDYPEGETRRMARGTTCYALQDALNEHPGGPMRTRDSASCGEDVRLAHITTDELAEALFLRWRLDGPTPAFDEEAAGKKWMSYWVGLRREVADCKGEYIHCNASWWYGEGTGELFLQQDLPFFHGVNGRLTYVVYRHTRTGDANGRLDTACQYNDEDYERDTKMVSVCEWDKEAIVYNIEIRCEAECYEILAKSKNFFVILRGNREVMLKWGYLKDGPNFLRNYDSKRSRATLTFQYLVRHEDLGQLHQAGIFVASEIADQPIEKCFVKQMLVEKRTEQCLGCVEGDKRTKEAILERYHFNLMSNIATADAKSSYIIASTTQEYGVPTASDCSQVFPGWQVAAVEIDGIKNCFATLPNRRANYKDAQAVCQEHNSRLAVIPEQDDHIKTMQKHLPIEEPILVGAVEKMGSDGHGWGWLTHTGIIRQITGTKQWKEGEPTATVDDTGDCAMMDLGTKKMRAAHCSEKHAIICQYSIPKWTHFLIGLHCSSQGDLQSCSWTDGTPFETFSHFSGPDFGLVVRLWEAKSARGYTYPEGFPGEEVWDDYNCVAMRYDGNTSVLVPWSCKRSILPTYEKYRYCDKMMCDLSAGCDSHATCGFQSVKQKPGWGVCRLLSGKSLISQCCKAVRGSFRFPSFTTTRLTGCLSFGGDKDDFSGNEWHSSTTLAHIGSYMEYVEISVQFKLYNKDPVHMYYIGAVCERNKTEASGLSKSFYSCKWTASDGRDDGSLAPDSYMWAFAFEDVHWRYYKAEEGTNMFDRPTGEDFDQHEKLCVAFWPDAYPGKLVLVDCNRKMRALLQTDKYFYGRDGAQLKSAANQMPRFINDQPMRLTQLDLPIELYLDNAQSVG